jgi:hypothetical protein
VNDHQPTPFKTLGSHLKYLRENSSETIAEVSGAVEINEDNLERIEQGFERPSEEILMLLINHFNMQEHEALRLWELAGYDRSNHPEGLGMSIQDEMQSGKTMIMLLTMDVRTQYTDGVEIESNDAGLVMTFTQAGGNGQAMPVAKVGMSITQAQAVCDALQTKLLKARYIGQKQLPASVPRRGRRRQLPKSRGASKPKSPSNPSAVTDGDPKNN